LESVKELKSGASGEQNYSAVDDGLIGRVSASNPMRNYKKDNAHTGHESSAEEDSGASGVSRAMWIFATYGLANANCGGGGDAQGNHVRKRHGVQCDLVSCQRHGTKASDQSSCECEDAALERKLHGRRKAKCDQTANAAKIGLDGSFEEFRAMARVVPEKVADEDKRHVSSRNGSGPTGTDRAHGGHAKFSVDQGPVAERVDDISGDESESHGFGHVHCLDATAHGEVEEKREEPCEQGFCVRNSESEHSRVYSHGAKECGEYPDGNRQKWREGNA